MLKLLIKKAIYHQVSKSGSTFCRFREQLIRHEVKDQLFQELNRQMERLGLIVKHGTLVDATIIESAVAKPSQGSDGSGGQSNIDKEASWTKKGGSYHFGYKAHLGVDQYSEIICKAELTPANIHDGELLGHVITEEEEWVFADKAYDSEKNSKILKKQKIENGILMKGRRNHKLSDTQKLCNKILSKFRSPVERVFVTFKRIYRYGRARYVGRQKNNLQLMLVCFGYNLRKMEKLCT